VAEEILAYMADDLDAPRATAAVDRWVAATLGTGGLADTSDPDAAVTMLSVVDAALGLAL
jgi:L-cysteine:1D-myo-inositol 2-amino-2-deoxy-alpha-D-glucopyranoside ligase